MTKRKYVKEELIALEENILTVSNRLKEFKDEQAL